MINCNCFNDWDYNCWCPIRFLIHTLALLKDHHLNMSNHMTKSIYVAVMKIIMMPSCPYFIFIDASTSKHEDIFIVNDFSLEDKRGLSLGELIRPFYIMLLYRYLSHYGLLFHVMPHYLWLFSLILQGLPWRGGMPAAGILAGKGANIGNLFCTAPKALKLHETTFWN